MRPRGSYGGVAAALCAQAEQPMHVATLAQRCGVGMSRARYTVSRLIDAGELVVIDGGRPMTVVHRTVAQAAAPVACGIEQLEAVMRGFWDQP
jgi:hypothetical protein